MAKKKLTVKQQAAIDAENEARLDAFEAFRDKYNGKEFSGRFHWFDGTSGEGMVSLDDGTSLYCHYSAIVGIDKNGYAYPAQGDVGTLEQYGREQVKIRVVPYISYGASPMCERVEVIG
jgi:cold shock CspA family protein